VTQPLAQWPGPTSHTPWASASVCGEGEPPHEEHAIVSGSAPLCLRRKQRLSLFVSAECSGLASSSLPNAAVQLLTRGPTSHTPWASASVCGEGEPPREDHATVCGSAPLQLCRKQRPILFTSTETNSSIPDMGAQAHETSSMRRWFLGAEKSNHHSHQYRASSRPPQKAEKVNFQNQCSSIEAPARGPAKPSSAKVMG
jgi:hypothetical protein